MSGPAEALRSCLDRGLTFAAFSWKNGLHLWVQEVSNLTRMAPKDLDRLEEVFPIAPFHKEDGTLQVLQPAHRLRLDKGAIDLASLRSCTGAPMNDAPHPEIWDRKDHDRAVDKALAAFRSGPLTKVVLSRCVAVPYPLELIPELFLKGVEDRPDAFVCLVNSAEHGVWLGASPERLISMEDDQLIVDAIAGTRPAVGVPKAAMDWNAKELDEQEQVTLGIIETFRTHGVNNLEVSGPFVLEAGMIAHLHTRIRTHLDPLLLAEVMMGLHPTAAVCGRPTEHALRFIREQEPNDRGLYAGFWGPWNVNGATSIHVNIRCLNWRNGMAFLHVGGGLTKGSSAEEEWQETEQKALTWLDLMRAIPPRVS